MQAVVKRDEQAPRYNADLNRQPRAVADSYKMLFQEYGQITIVPHGELFEIGKQPAMLKTEI